MIGSGKSTLAKALASTHPNFARLSIDTYVHQLHGMFAVDYPSDRYEEYQKEAEDALRKEFEHILSEGKRDVVLDFSFYSREYRDDWRDVALSKAKRNNGQGVRILIVYFEATKEALWNRIQARRKGVRDAGSAAETSKELLASYVKGFEKPTADEEGDVIVIRVE
jgi:predicted kinase